MKKASQFFIILPIFFFIIVSCNPDSKKAERILQSAERFAEQLLMDKQRILFLFLVMTLALFTSVLLYYCKKKKDEKAILLAEREIYKLKEIIKNTHNKETDSKEKGKDAIEINKKLQEALAGNFGILKGIALLENLLSDEEIKKGKDLLKRIYTIIYGHSERYDRNFFVDMLNNLYSGYADKLMKKAPQLKEIEFRIY